MTNAPDRCPLRILLVDDEPDLYLAIGEVLRDAGHEVHTAHDGEQALQLMTSLTVDVVMTDIRLPKLDGLSLFRLVRERWPATIVILVTAFAEVHDAIAAVREGAHDYLRKPLTSEDIARRIERISAQVSIQRQLCKARLQLARLDGSQQIVGRSAIMCQMMDRLNTIAASDASVLLLGETGTGKELVARALHDRSPRHGKPFVAVNCASFPDTLLEAELFGHERGAFTGAVARRSGRFQAAHGGTLLLDEVGDMSIALQVKLLRVLEDHAIEPLGTNSSIPVDVRVIAATHRNLRQMIKAGLFREDLYYRLNVLSLDLPPLRARDGDLPLLAQYFLNKFHRRGRPPARVSPAAWSALSAFDFPGNVRQLGHAIEHATVMAGEGEIEPRHLPAEIIAGPGAVTIPRAVQTLQVAKEEFARQYMRRVLADNDGKRGEALKILGISRKHLWEKLRNDEAGETIVPLIPLIGPLQAT
jgi:two-component system, NtrC family, response regulator AtoC